MNNDFLTDEELDNMFDEQSDYSPQAHAQTALAPVEEYPMPEPVPLYALELASAGQAPPTTSAPAVDEGLLNKKLGPLPAWAWGLITLGVGGTGYFFYRSRKVAENPGDNDDSGPPKLGEILSKALGSGSDDALTGGSWAPSRSRFAEQVERYYQRKGQAQHVKVWHDAEDAKEKGGLKFVSPLVNVQVKDKSVKIDQALTRFCRREGLNPVQHADGSIGLYPHASKRGKEWEEYIDALRDDGQQV